MIASEKPRDSRLPIAGAVRLRSQRQAKPRTTMSALTQPMRMRGSRSDNSLTALEGRKTQ